MRTIALLLVLLGLSVPVWGYEVRMRVVDENGTPVAGAEAVISFVASLQSSTVEHIGRTGPDGVFSAKGEQSLQLYLEANKAGHYEARIYRPPPKSDLGETVVLPRILEPMSLYAWDTRIGRAAPGPTFPVQNEWLGFDFEAADWVAPHGAGKVPDIRFRFRNEFKGYEDNIKNLEEAIVFSKRAFAARREESVGWVEERNPTRIQAGGACNTGERERKAVRTSSRP